MSQPNGSAGIDASGLRERLPQKPDAPQKALSVETAQQAVEQLNKEEQEKGKDEKNTRTYGRTSDGTGEYFVYS
jgi:phosphatidylethanolamine N-methyltransferase